LAKDAGDLVCFAAGLAGYGDNAHRVLLFVGWVCRL
jgi:hypothetical protein